MVEGCCLSGMWQHFLGNAFCPISFSGRLLKVEVFPNGVWGCLSQPQLNHLCVPHCNFHSLGRPSQQQGWCMAAHSSTRQDTQHTSTLSQRRDRLSWHYLSLKISCVQRSSHLALRPTLSLMNKVEDLPKNKLYIARCILVLYPHSCFHKHHPFPHFRLLFDTTLTLHQHQHRGPWSSWTCIFC